MLLGDGTAARLANSDAATRDTMVVVPLVLAVILLVLMALLRAVVAPLYILGTVVLSFLASSVSRSSSQVLGETSVDATCRSSSSSSSWRSASTTTSS